MGFRNNTYAKVWSVEPKSDVNTKVRISISKKNRETGSYEQDFSGFVSFIGSACAKKAAALKEGDRIKIGDVDVSSFFSKEKNKEYITFKCFSFEDASFGDSGTPSEASTDLQPTVDSGEIDDARLPF